MHYSPSHHLPHNPRLRGSAFNYPEIYQHIKIGQQMRECGKDKVEGWQGWLQKYGLWDDSMEEEELYLRYMKFHKVTFSEVPEG